MNARARRINRWDLRIPYESPEDYVRKLQELGAIVVVTLDDGRYLVFREPAKRQGKIESAESVRGINQLWWQVLGADAIQALAEGLNLEKKPKNLAIFIPVELEQAMTKAERAAAGNLSEDAIEAKRLRTSFYAARKGQTFDVKVLKQWTER